MPHLPPRPCLSATTLVYSQVPKSSKRQALRKAFWAAQAPLMQSRCMINGNKTLRACTLHGEFISKTWTVVPPRPLSCPQRQGKTQSLSSCSTCWSRAQAVPQLVVAPTWPSTYNSRKSWWCWLEPTWLTGTCWLISIHWNSMRLTTSSSLNSPKNSSCPELV